MRAYLDSNALIAAVEGPPAGPGLSSTVMGRSLADTLVTSELSLAEVLVKPLRDQDFALIEAYNSLLFGGSAARLQTIPISRDILGRAASVRNQKTSIKLPDAIHIATAEIMGCDQILTGDKRWVAATQIPLTDITAFNLIGFLEMLS
ncbi:MAG: hypothetical protein B7Z15_15730 [Rhizobiales bacterium 32-66-8]|nr:MAG: hypothetical protein B7Z15_15730 [Rhizobiales bacterium 32-66-8]